MVETALAVFFITMLFLGVFQIAHMVTAKILLDHAAARAARAKAVGFNDWMCIKSARVAMIPVAGARTWPQGGTYNEAARVPNYMATETPAQARGILDYERWGWMDVDLDSDSGIGAEVEARVTLAIPRFYSRGYAAEGAYEDALRGAGDEGADMVEVVGESRIESHYPFYMYDQGL